MKFLLIADNENGDRFFFPLGEVILFVVFVSLLFYLLFPQNLLQKTLSYHEPSAAVLGYLQAFERLYPNEMALKFAVIEQEINLGLVKSASTRFAQINKQPLNILQKSQIAWLDYLILRYKAFKAKPTTQKRIDYLLKLRERINALANAPLEKRQLQTIAMDSLALAQPALSLKIYNSLLAKHELTSPEDFAMGGNIAMQNNAHLDSARFYKAAYAAAKTISEKRKYALDVLQVLWNGNKVDQALEFAKQLPKSITNDRDLLIYMARLAMAGNKPEVAEKYALKALLFNAHKNHE